MLSIPSLPPICCPCVTFVHRGVRRGTASVGFKTPEIRCSPTPHQAKNCRIVVVFGFKRVLELCHRAFPYLASSHNWFCQWEALMVLFCFFLFLQYIKLTWI